MALQKALQQSSIKNLTLIKQGKVRDLYDAGENLLIVSTDRLSAFDVIMKQGIPGKGIILTKMAEYWFKLTQQDIPNHCISFNAEDIHGLLTDEIQSLKNRVMLVKKTNVVPLECIVRGYLAGTGWQDYSASGEICGYKLPKGLLESSKLPEPLFTPSTKAAVGTHDENISTIKAMELVGEKTYQTLKDYSLQLYAIASKYAEAKGIIIADTKFEFGIDEAGKVILIDEILTPDSSRFWLKERWQPGVTQINFDKQYVRDFLLSINFNKQPPPPDLPDEVINRTLDIYKEAYKLLTGADIEL